MLHAKLVMNLLQLCLPIGAQSECCVAAADRMFPEMWKVRDAPAKVTGERSRHISRPLMRSATRSALAMIVSVGLTAPIDGKKLASAI